MLEESSRGFLPRWSADVHRTEEHGLLQLQRDRGHDSQGSPGIQANPHTRPPARGPHPCSCRSYVLCPGSHRRHSHAQPANQRRKTAVALYRSTKPRKAAHTLLPNPYSNLQRVTPLAFLWCASRPRCGMLNSWPKVSRCHSQVVNPSLSKAGVQRTHFSLSRLAFVKEKPQTNLILKGKAISQCQAIWFSTEKKLGT